MAEKLPPKIKLTSQDLELGRVFVTKRRNSALEEVIYCGIEGKGRNVSVNLFNVDTNKPFTTKLNTFLAGNVGRARIIDATPLLNAEGETTSPFESSSTLGNNKLVAIIPKNYREKTILVKVVSVEGGTWNLGLDQKDHEAPSIIWRAEEKAIKRGEDEHNRYHIITNQENGTNEPFREDANHILESESFAPIAISDPDGFPIEADQDCRLKLITGKEIPVHYHGINLQRRTLGFQSKDGRMVEIPLNEFKEHRGKDIDILPARPQRQLANAV